MNSDNFPNPDKEIKLPRKPFLAVVRQYALSTFRSVFSPESGVLIGYGIALSSVVSSSVGYYAVINSIALPLGFAGLGLFGLSIIPAGLAIAASLTIQAKEIAPNKYIIFPHLADRAAYKAGKTIMVNPKETSDTPSMLPQYKFLARNGDSIRAKKERNESTICYVLEGVGALTAVGFFLGSQNPMIQIGAIFWGAYSVFGCEFGLGHAEKCATECLDASQERDYRLEKAKLQEQN